MRHNLISAALIGVASLSAPTMAAAQTQAATPLEGVAIYGQSRDLRTLSRTVSYGDLDLRTDRGVKVLWRRINATADALCEQLGEPRYAAASGSMLPSCSAIAISRVKWDVHKAVQTAGRG